MSSMYCYRGTTNDSSVGILSRVRFPPPPFTSSTRPVNAGDFSAASARLRPTEADSEGPTRNSPHLAFLPQIPCNEVFNSISREVRRTLSSRVQERARRFFL